MLLERFYDESLAQAGYLIGCQATGEAVVVDPNVHIEAYRSAAARERLRIVKVTETHIHADFVSGARALAHAAGAELLLSDEGGEGWRYGFAAREGATLLHGGDSFSVGNIRFDVLHTPGHTPEHLAFLVTDGAASDRPMGMFTGDFIFVGDVGRPDLLERAAGVAGSMEAAARTLFRSLRRMQEYPDYLQIWPGHGAGSACGKTLGAVPATTLGYERLVNWAFQITDEDRFVQEVLAGQPEPPRYFAEMKRINRDSQPRTVSTEPPPRKDLAAVERAIQDGPWVIDVRPTAEFARGHIPGTVNVPFGRSFATYVGTVVPITQPLILLVPGDAGEQRARDVQRALALIGFDALLGWAGTDVLDAWRASGRDLAVTPQMDARELAQARDRTIIDVRNASEWNAGHLPGARRIFLGDLRSEAGDIPRDTPLVLQCQTGSRSAIAASVLRAHGFTDVANLKGGLEGWRRAGLPVETSDASAGAPAS